MTAVTSSVSEALSLLTTLESSFTIAVICTSTSVPVDHQHGQWNRVLDSLADEASLTAMSGA